MELTTEARGLMLALLACGAARAYAQEKATVPPELRGGGNTLRTDDATIPLDGDAITVQPGTEREHIELVDRHGRIVDDAHLKVDATVLDRVEPRSWRVGLYLGAVAASGNAYKKLLLDSPTFAEVGVEGAYQPGPFGVALAFASLSAQANRYGVDSTYTAAQSRLAGTYEFAPFSARGPVARRFHFVASAGGHLTHHKIELDDGDVKVDDTHLSGGPYGAFDVMYPFNSFWFGGRLSMSYQKVSLPKVGFESKSVQTGVLIGGHYAF
jgi:hypothetical protein